MLIKKGLNTFASLQKCSKNGQWLTAILNILYMSIKSPEPAACGVVSSICADICPIATENIPIVSILGMAYVHIHYIAS